MTGSRTPRLWHRNVIGAVVAAGALATSVAVTMWPLWADYLSTVRPAHVVAPDQSITAYGQTWAVRGVAVSQRDPGSNAPLPEGTVMTTVTVEHSGSIPADFRCYGILTDGERRWRALWGYCNAAGPVDWRFLVPAGTEPTAIDITGLDQSILLRLQL